MTDDPPRYDFDEIIDRRGTNANKWDGMAERYGDVPEDAIPMWVADMDFRPPEAVNQALREMIAHGVYGYPANYDALNDAVAAWMRERHGWEVDPNHIFSTHGLTNAIGLCLAAFTEPGDGIVVFSPVYHAFGRVVRAAGRALVECPLTADPDGRYRFDFEAYQAQMTGRERMILLCSPHNPGGRVWSREELEGVVEFARRNDLILVSDEVHHDLVYDGGPRHVPTGCIDGVQDRLITLTAATKTFNLAGVHLGQVTIADPALRSRFAAQYKALSVSAGAIPPVMIRAAYSRDGAEWLAQLLAYLDGNRALFDAGVAAIPGVRSMPLEATYLAWVDFSALGMDDEEITRRVFQEARIVVNLGPTFGTGGAGFLRFNFATPRARVQEAVDRLQAAFADVQ